MASPNSSSLRSDPRPAHSCLRCAERKVKCDRRTPCENCVRHNAQCAYRQNIPPPQRHSRAKYDRLREQVRKYERLLQEHGIAPDSDPSLSAPTTRLQPTSGLGSRPSEIELTQPTPASTTSGNGSSIGKTQVLQIEGRTRFVDNDLWTRVVEEFDHHEKTYDESSDDASNPDEGQDESDFFLGSAVHASRSTFRVSSEHLRELWEIFVQNIDPVTKIVHVPTVRKILEKAAYDANKMSKPMVALMFAVSSAAAISLVDGLCEQQFGISREKLVLRYLSATKIALSRADLIGTTSLVVLQAFAFYILAVRDFEEPRVVWRLTGMAIRIAESMGLHRDGAVIGLSPFESEIRRRMWWNIKMHDFRTAELAGLVKWQNNDQHIHAPRIPTNVNDSELYAGMAAPPTPSDRPSDAIFCVLRSQFAVIKATKIDREGSQRAEFGPGDETKRQEAIIEDYKNEIEMKVLRFLDPSNPIQLLTMLLARSSFNIGTFMMHHPARWSNKSEIPEKERNLIWTVSIDVLGQHSMMISSPQLRKFAWNTKYHTPWHAMIHVLDVLARFPFHEGAQKAWELTRTVFDTIPEMISNTCRLLFIAVGNLCLKAYEQRETVLAIRGESIEPTPEYVIKLRQQREARIAKKLKSNLSNTENARSLNLGTDDVTDINAGIRGRDNKDVDLGRSDTDVHLDHDGRSGDEDYQFSSRQSNPTFTSQLELPQDLNFDFDGSLNQDFNWAQWDSWLGSINAAEPDFSQ